MVEKFQDVGGIRGSAPCRAASSNLNKNTNQNTSNKNEKMFCTFHDHTIGGDQREQNGVSRYTKPRPCLELQLGKHRGGVLITAPDDKTMV